MVIFGHTMANAVIQMPEVECTKIAALSRIHCTDWSGHL
jgi:hypothetical protein